MKALKILSAIALLCGPSHAATITVSSGLPSQGFTVLVDTVVPTNFNVAVGTWNSITSTFTQFGSTVLDTAKVNGVFAATAPTAVNGGIIHVFVGTGSGPGVGSAWILFRANANTAFPADVTGTGAVTFSATVATNLTTVASDGRSNISGTNLNLVTVPEPSTALLGLLGIAGLIRRRR